METKNNMDLRTYVQPETEEIRIESERILAGVESGGEGTCILDEDE